MEASDELLRRSVPSALLTPDGVIHRLNAAMAVALGTPAERCVGRGFGSLLPDGQRTSAEALVSHGVSTKSVVMRTLEFPGPGGASVVCLLEARPVRDPADGGRLVWVHSLDAGNDLRGLLIPFRLAARAAGLGLCLYSPEEQRLEWLGGAPVLAALFPEASVSLAGVFRLVHADDRKALRRLLRSTGAKSPWIRVRFLTEDDGWHYLVCQTRRVHLGYGGPEQVFAMFRDDTKGEARRRRALAAVSAERQRAAEIAEFSSALMAAATEQQLQQVVLTRLAATFGGTGAALAFVDEGRLRVSSDAGVPLSSDAAANGLPLDERAPLSFSIRTGTPQFIPSREDYVRRWPGSASPPWPDPRGSAYAVSIVPLNSAGGRPLGAWWVGYDGEHRSSHDERALMSTLADLAGEALLRIRLQETRIALATAVQETMLPTLPEHLPGLEIAARYRPSRDGLDIGGDWYDAFVMSDGAVALEIGDAQGHDVAAAAFMGQVRLALRAIAAGEPDPGAVLARVNDFLVTMDAARFASCTFLHVDPRDGQVTGTSAGHVPLLFAREDGSHAVLKLPGGPVLGVAPESDYPEDDFTLDQGTVLIMVTDGAVEGPNLTLEAGLGRAGSAAAEALGNGLDLETTADRILDAAAAVDHLDDVAVLVVRRGR